MFTGLFTSQLALDEATRLWDVYVFEGDAVLIRAGVAFLMLKEMSLLGTKSLAEVKEILDANLDRTKPATQVLSGNAEEERWMRAVRDAGKA